jgi:predicted neuraminidase
MLFYKVGKTISEWITKCKISYDNCQSFGEAFEMVPGDTSGGRGPVRNKAIYLKDGSIIGGASTECGEWKCFFDRSFDEGKSWQRSHDVCLTREELAKHDATRKIGKIKREGIIQPTLWESREGVHALMRSTEGVIYRTDSFDGNEWCVPYPIDIPNNNSGIDLCVLPDERSVLACNPTSSWDYRTPMSLYVSSDNGHTFELLTHLATGVGEFSYPAIRYENGHLHVTYTWNRKTVQYFCFTEI